MGLRQDLIMALGRAPAGMHFPCFALVRLVLVGVLGLILDFALMFHNTLNFPSVAIVRQ